MNGAASIFAIVAVLGALILAVSGLRSHRIPLERKAWMALAWVLIIVGLALIIGWFAP